MQGVLWVLPRSGAVAEQNGLSLYWTRPGAGGSVSAEAGSTTLKGSNLLGVRPGEYLAVTVRGQRHSRRVLSVNTGGAVHEAVVGPTAYSADVITSLPYEHGKRVLSVSTQANDVDTVKLGGDTPESSTSLHVNGGITLAGVYSMAPVVTVRPPQPHI